MYKKGVYAGTFGPLHEGHKEVIRQAMKVVRHLTIGIMDTHIARKKTKGTNQRMPSYGKRYLAVKAFMKDEFPNRYDITTVFDGIKDGMDFDGQVMVISHENSVIVRALEINDLRREAGLHEFVILVVPMVRDEDGLLSSTRIRESEIK